MTEPLADFLNADGLQKFASGDQVFFLGAAVDMIRHFCGWHIAPSLAVVDARIRVGQQGLISLPTLQLTSVDSLVVDGRALVEHDDYEWDDTGIITLARPFDPCVAWDWPDRWATVGYTHGYPETPRDVAAIGYELVQQARSKPGGNAKDMGAGPYRVTLLKLGVGLDDDQKSRLWESGVVRAGIA